MTRARERLIVSGSVDFGKASEVPTPIAWVLERLEADEELAAAGDAPVELVRGDARLLVRVDRYREETAATRGGAASRGGGPARALRRRSTTSARAVRPAPLLPELAAVAGAAAPARPPALVHGALDVRAVRVQVLGALRDRPRPSRTCRAARAACPGVEVGSRVHELLEHIDLAAPVVPEIEDERVRAHVTAYVDSPLARRLGSLPGVTKERHFTFEHDGVLVHGFLDVLQLADGKALVVDYKTNLIGESSPEEIVEADYRLQRLVYALACFRAGAEEVEVDLPVPRAAGRAGRGAVHARRRRRARGRALRCDRAAPGRRVPADAERVRVRGLPCSRPRLRGPAPAPAAAALVAS